jgi:uncharacterized protein YjbK
MNTFGVESWLNLRVRKSETAFLAASKTPTPMAELEENSAVDIDKGSPWVGGDTQVDAAVAHKTLAASHIKMRSSTI